MRSRRSCTGRGGAADCLDGSLYSGAFDFRGRRIKRRTPGRSAKMVELSMDRQGTGTRPNGRIPVSCLFARRRAVDLWHSGQRQSDLFRTDCRCGNAADGCVKILCKNHKSMENLSPFFAVYDILKPVKRLRIRNAAEEDHSFRNHRDI